MKIDPLTIVMVLVLVVLIIFMFRNSRKRKAMQEELQNKVVTGARVMTNSGVFGTILSMDDETNEVKLETHPGTILTVHRQTVGRVIEPVEQDDSILAAEAIDADYSSTEPTSSHTDVAPEFGERTDAPRNAGD